MQHLFLHVLIKWTLYPLFYWIGYAVTKACTLGKASIIAFEEAGQEDSVAWYDFYVSRFGIKFWLPETMILIGVVTLGLAIIALYVWHSL